MDQDQQRSLQMLGTGFTTDEAIEALDWTGTRRGLVHHLEGLGYEKRKGHTPGRPGVRTTWRSPHRRDDCTCRCHTGTCGENDMVLAERAIRLIERLRPLGADTVAVLDNLVQRAGVDFAREALPGYRYDNEVPF